MTTELQDRCSAGNADISVEGDERYPAFVRHEQALYYLPLHLTSAVHTPITSAAESHKSAMVFLRSSKACGAAPNKVS